MNIFKFNNGDKVRDDITKYTGVVVSRSEWLNGCIRYIVQPDKLNKDGGIDEGYVFDEQQLTLVKAAKKPGMTNAAKGGPKRDVRSSFPAARAAR